MKHFKQMDISTEKKYRLINYNFKLILFVIAAMIMGSITICSGSSGLPDETIDRCQCMYHRYDRCITDRL